MLKGKSTQIKLPLGLRRTLREDYRGGVVVCVCDYLNKSCNVNKVGVYTIVWIPLRHLITTNQQESFGDGQRRMSLDIEIYRFVFSQSKVRCQK
jgi:hypothetical protein